MAVEFKKLFEAQMNNQQAMLNKGLYDAFKNQNTFTVPSDDPKLESYHIQQLISEIGEVLSADKRWKNLRNDKNDSMNKLEEIADCFIVMMNVAMFSGFTSEQVLTAIEEKINTVRDRIGKQ